MSSRISRFQSATPVIRNDGVIIYPHPAGGWRFAKWR